MQSLRAGDGARIAFREIGSGDTRLLFVHGWQADGSVWQDLISAIGPGFRSLAIDLRGSGASDAAAGPYRLERYAADLRELIESLDAGPVVVVGHSMGATVALRLAVDAPHLVSALVLVAPVPASGGGYSPKGEAFLRSTAGDPVAARNWLARTFHTPPDPAVLDRLCAAAATMPRDAALESFDSWAFAGFAEETTHVAAPALVISPEHDAPERAESEVAALLPNARFELLPGSGHYAILERPAEIAALIRTFLAAR